MPSSPEACEECLGHGWPLLSPAPPDVERIRRAMVRAGAWACCRHDGHYPAALTDDPSCPPVLFGRGDHDRLRLLASPRRVVCVVGARRPSAYGRQLAESLGRELGAAGMVVVSGMALGIDSRAHSGALAAGGATVAVLGSGPDVPYPARMRHLYEEIVKSGLILTELPPGTQARKWTVPARTRIMAALAAMTIVVEARRRSGSLITATMASDLGREVGAVPGRVGNSTSDGTNSLLRDGAQVVRGAQDVLDSLLGAGVLERAVRLGSGGGPALEGELPAVLELVELGAGSADAVATAGGLAPSVAAAALSRLELLGYLSCDSAGRFQRTTLATPAEVEEDAREASA